MKLRIVCGATLLALLLSACGAAGTAPASPAADPYAAQPSQAPAAAQPSAPAVSAQASAVAAIGPTPTFEVVVDAEPSAAAQASLPAAPSAAVVAGAASGNSAWRDQVLRSDALLVAVDNLQPAANGEVYSAWLAGADSSLPLGALAPVPNGPATVTYTAPGHDNLLGAYDRVYVSKSATADATAKLGEVVLAGQLPQQALVHVRHVLFSIGITPAKLGFALGLRQEIDELLRHAQFLQEAYDTGDLALEKVHAEHIINIISGAQAPGFGDLNGDGKAQNPGDGYGLLPNGQQDGYIKGMSDHARLAAESPDATENIKLHAGHVQIAGDNTAARVQQVQDAARRVLQAPGAAQSQGDVLNILALSQQAIQGIDLNNDEQIAPVPGEGGVITAYQHAQLMAGIELSAAAVATVSPPPVAVAAPAGAAQQQLAIDIADNTFSAAKITVPVGASVVWTHTGQKKHTVTADDGSFDSGELTNGGSFAHTFAAPGTYQYYCTIHGGAGGQGMTATIVVVDAAATQAAAQPSAATAAAQPSDHGHASAAAAAPSQAPAASVAAPQAPAPAPAAGKIDVAIGDNTYTQKEISVPLGTTISWSHSGQRPHTVTADDGSFNSATLQNGGNFEQTFNTPGVYAYYCEFHGGPGGVGMSGVIRVEDR